MLILNSSLLHYKNRRRSCFCTSQRVADFEAKEYLSKQTDTAKGASSVPKTFLWQ
jgi:hypothetical protein